MDGLLQVGAIAGTLTTIATAFFLAIRWARRTLVGLCDFLEDWNGEAPRPGVPERPGVMQRLACIEAQLHPNGGGSVRDVLDRIEGAIGGDPPG